MKNTITAVGIMLFTALVCAGVQQKVTENLKQITESQAAVIAAHTLSVKKLTDDAVAAKLDVAAAKLEVQRCQEKLSEQEKAYCAASALAAQYTRENKKLAEQLASLLVEKNEVADELSSLLAEKDSVATSVEELQQELVTLKATIPAPVVVDSKVVASSESLKTTASEYFNKLTAKVSEMLNKQPAKHE